MSKAQSKLHRPHSRTRHARRPSRRPGRVIQGLDADSLSSSFHLTTPSIRRRQFRTRFAADLRPYPHFSRLQPRSLLVQRNTNALTTLATKSPPVSFVNAGLVTSTTTRA